MLLSRLDSDLQLSQFELTLGDIDDLEFLRAFALDRQQRKNHITDLINALPRGWFYVCEYYMSMLGTGCFVEGCTMRMPPIHSPSK
ncbi:hypothetical protein FI667_g12484, partial [Globisporangium splendens]